MPRIFRAFPDATRRCRESGLNGVEVITSSHILGQFLSPLSNLRRNGAPVPGEHTCDILREAGCDDAEIEATVAAKVLREENAES